jgi:hypothetical protein
MLKNKSKEKDGIKSFNFESTEKDINLIVSGKYVFDEQKKIKFKGIYDPETSKLTGIEIGKKENKVYLGEYPILEDLIKKHISHFDEKFIKTNENLNEASSEKYQPADSGNNSGKSTRISSINTDIIKKEHYRGTHTRRRHNNVETIFATVVFPQEYSFEELYNGGFIVEKDGNLVQTKEAIFQYVSYKLKESDGSLKPDIKKILDKKIKEEGIKSIEDYDLEDIKSLEKEGVKIYKRKSHNDFLKRFIDDLPENYNLSLLKKYFTKATVKNGEVVCPKLRSNWETLLENEKGIDSKEDLIEKLGFYNFGNKFPTPTKEVFLAYRERKVSGVKSKKFIEEQNLRSYKPDFKLAEKHTSTTYLQPNNKGVAISRLKGKEDLSDKAKLSMGLDPKTGEACLETALFRLGNNVGKAQVQKLKDTLITFTELQDKYPNLYKVIKIK